LKVLDQRQRQQHPVIDLLHDRRDILPADFRGSSEASLTCYQLVAIAARSRSDDYRLKQTIHSETPLQLGELAGLELRPRLIRIGMDLRNRNSLQRLSVGRLGAGGTRGARTRRQESFEPASQAARLISRHAGALVGCLRERSFATSVVRRLAYPASSRAAPLHSGCSRGVAGSG